jgi:hypothetical protein
MQKDSVILAAARAAHEANRAWCLACGDTSQVAWEDAPPEFHAASVSNVMTVLAGGGPREAHDTWMEDKAAGGWKWGPAKDAEAKTHPCMVPYEDLPAAQLAKDDIFVSVVRAVLTAGGVLPPRP